METIADLIASHEPTESRGIMGRPKHDEDPDERKRHVDCAVDRVIRQIPVAECMHRYGVRSPRTVCNFIRYALAYDDDPMALILRRVVNSRRAS